MRGHSLTKRLGHPHAAGTTAIDMLETTVEREYPTMTTAELAEFWQGVTEAATLRLIRLKPEMVRRWPPEP